MARSWVIDGKGIANKVKNASLPCASEIKDTRECPHCNNLISNTHEWPGLPAGVKFEPSDADLIQHLAAKCGLGESQPNLFLDDFIPTISSEEGICYTHPQNLPGAKKDGSSIHFFHRTVNAYASGQRKRRKIQSEQVRWHKTGKTKAVMENGVQRGCKKILVLYRSAKRGCKPDKANWVMHQYHLGTEEDEQHGYYVVSKIFYQQPKHSSQNNASDSEVMSLLTSPRTPNILNPPPRAQTDMFADPYEDNNTLSYAKEGESYLEAESGYVPNTFKVDSHGKCEGWLSEEPGLDGIDEALSLCKELFNSNTHKSEWGQHVNSFNNNIAGNIVNNTDAIGSNNMASACGIDDLVNLELDTPPDFKLTDLQFPNSQDSLFDWIEHL